MVISNEVLKLKEGFSPIASVGSTSAYGPVLIINN
jgi:hypothetical protein